MTAHGTSSTNHEQTHKELDHFVRACVRSATAGGDSVVLHVRGKCMDPILEDGKPVKVQQAKWYMPGDIVAYYSPHLDRSLIHRFLGYIPAGGTWKCLIMPDHGSRPDVLVDTADVLGKIIDGRTNARQRCRSLWRYVYWTVRIALRLD